jgi:hypothetical protein
MILMRQLVVSKQNLRRLQPARLRGCRTGDYGGGCATGGWTFNYKSTLDRGRGLKIIRNDEYSSNIFIFSRT